MAHSKVIDKIVDELFEQVFDTERNPYYGKFVDEDGIYKLENGSMIKMIDGRGDNDG